MITRRVVLNTLTVAGALGALSAVPIARAQPRTVGGWPNRVVKIVVPAGAGGQTDLFARFMADQLGKAFGQPFIIDNKPGASGNIGAMAVVRSPSDGYNLLFTAGSFSVVPQALQASPPYDLLKDLQPIVQIGAGGQFLAVSANSSIKSVADLLAKAQSGQMNYGTTGIGSVTHILMASLLEKGRVKMTHIPYKSGAEVLRELMSGTLEVGWVDTTTGGAAAKADKIRLLGISGTIRVPGNPDIKTLQEQGYGLDLNGWLGLFARAGTPDAIVTAINNEVLRIMNSEEAQSRLTAMNIGVFPANTPEQYAQTVQRDLQAWKKIIVDNNIKAE